MKNENNVMKKLIGLIDIVEKREHCKAVLKENEKTNKNKNKNKGLNI